MNINGRLERLEQCAPSYSNLPAEVAGLAGWLDRLPPTPRAAAFDQMSNEQLDALVRIEHPDVDWDAMSNAQLQAIADGRLTLAEVRRISL